MASTSNSSSSGSRRQSYANGAAPADSPSTANSSLDLAQSLKKLSLAPKSPADSPRSPKPLTPFKGINRTSQSPAAAARMSPRSPSIGRDATRSSTPSLVRKTSTSSLHSVATARPSTSLSRRASATNLMGPIMDTMEEIKPQPTASSIAKDFFTADLEANHGEKNSSQYTDALVILHDSCYGHRWQRPNTTDDDLATIVERPERLRAAALGVALAYVRLGERHADGAYSIHPKLRPETIENLPFRIIKTARSLPLLSPVVTAVHGKEWMTELAGMCGTVQSKWSSNQKIEVKRQDTGRRSTVKKPALHHGDLYLCPESLGAIEGALGAVCEGVDRVFGDGDGPRRAFVSVRPPGHHCSDDFPSGFCWVNNVHVGIAHAMTNHGVTHAAILDFDLHHGDGSQSIALDLNEKYEAKGAAIGYFSLHDINSYPCEFGSREKVLGASMCIEGAHNQNIWNVHLQPWKTEEEFWEHYNQRYAVLLAKMRSFLQRQGHIAQQKGKEPKAVIFLSAGFDASEHETGGMQRHKVMVPTEFYARISQDIVEMAAEEDSYVDGRVISVLEGGYSDKALCSGICSHISGLVGDQRENIPGGIGYQPGLGLEVAKRRDTVRGQRFNDNAKRTLSSTNPYDSSWWGNKEITALLDEVNKGAPEPKKSRQSGTPTYCSPTHASTARAVDPSRLRRSMSGLSYSRPPTPPPPEVPWVIAAHELSKLLIPEDRPTESSTSEEIRTMISHLRHRSVPEVKETHAPTSTRTGLRDRRGKQITSIREEEVKEAKNRRKTVAATDSAMMGSAATGSAALRRSSRRLSAASVLPGIMSKEASPERSVGDSREGRLPPSVNITRATTGSTSAASSRPGSSLAVRKTRPAAARKDSVQATRAVKKPVGSAPVRKSSSPVAKKSAERTASRAEPEEQRLVPRERAPSSSPARSSSISPRRKLSRSPESPDPTLARQKSASPGMKQITSGVKKIILKSNKPHDETSQQGDLGTTSAKAVSNNMAGKSTSNVAKIKETIEGNNKQNEVAPNATVNGAKPRTKIVIKSRANSKQSTPVATPTATSPRRSPRRSLRSSPERPKSPEKVNGTSHMLSMPQPGQVQSREKPCTPVCEKPMSITSPDPQKVPLPASSPEGVDLFVPYQPEGPDPVPVAVNEPLTFLPPNMSAAPTPLKKGDMPKFTSTSAIPFAARKVNGDARGQVKNETSDRSIWGIPETPAKQ